MSWASIASKKQSEPVKIVSKPKEEPVKIQIKKDEIQPIDVFDHHFGDKIFEELSSFTIKESANNDLLRTYNATSSDLYHFFLDYVDVDYYAESKMNKNADEDDGASDDDYDYY